MKTNNEYKFYGGPFPHVVCEDFLDKNQIDGITSEILEISKKKYMPLQKGDVIKTHCDNNLFKRKYNYSPSRSVNYGVKKFIDWYKSYYKK